MTEEQAKKYTRTISLFPRIELREAVKDEIELLLLDYGQKFDATEVKYLVDRTTSLLESKYRTWLFNDFRIACEMGKVGQFPTATGIKLTMRLVQQWVWHYDNIRMKRALDEQKRIHNAKKHSIIIDPKSSFYSKALIWKLSFKDAFAQHGNWDECPLSRVVDALKNGTTQQLRDELFK